MSEERTLQQAQQDLAQAKATLLHLAAEAEPLAGMRAHPWATAAVAVAVGTMLGSGGTRGSLLRFARAAAAIVLPLVRLLHQPRECGPE